MISHILITSGNAQVDKITLGLKKSRNMMKSDGTHQLVPKQNGCKCTHPVGRVIGLCIILKRNEDERKW